MPHERLVNQAAMLGTEAILQQLPAEHTPALERAIHQSVRQAVLHYAQELEALNRRLRPLAHAGARR